MARFCKKIAKLQKNHVKKNSPKKSCPISSYSEINSLLGLYGAPPSQHIDGLRPFPSSDPGMQI